MILKKWFFMYTASLVAMSSVFTEAQDGKTWIERLPPEIRSQIMWNADYETGGLTAWRKDFKELGGGLVSRSGGGIVKVIPENNAHSGKDVAQCKISNARCPSSKKGAQMVRYAMGNAVSGVKTGKGYLPQEAYFSTWMLFGDFPAASKCGSNGGLLKIFDFKSDPNPGNGNFGSETESMFSITVDHDPKDEGGKPFFSMYSKYNDGSYNQIRSKKRKKIPVNRWIHLEAFYSVNNRNGGQIIVWQNGEKILEASEVCTGLTPNGMDQFPIWALGPYTDDGGPWEDISILFDDSIISMDRVSRYITWRQLLPQSVQDAIIWSADHESGNMNEWYLRSGGGIFLSRGDNEWPLNDDKIYARATDSAVTPHTGRYAAEATISRAKGVSEGVRLMRNRDWQDKQVPPKGVGYFYSTWMYFADTYEPALFFNVFQFKSDPNPENENGNDSESKYSLNVAYDKVKNKMYFYLNYKKCPGSDEKENQRQRYQDEEGKRYITRREWIHVEAFYKLDNGEQGKPRGRIVIWQDGKKILWEDNVVTSCTPTEMVQYPIWGLGAYTNDISGGIKDGQATIYFDDAMISKVKTYTYIE